MRRRFRTGGTQGAINYLSAASLVEFIDRSYGRDRLRAFWQNGGMNQVRQTLSVSRPALEMKWRAHVAEQRPPEEWRKMAVAIEQFGCE